MAKEKEPKADASAVDPRDAEIEALKAEVAALKLEVANLGTAQAAPFPQEGLVNVRGELYKVTGEYRADNTFVEVKRGYCHEGTTLLGIERIS